ncbi:hypothetical protein HRI_002281700 [Hibiscus trionum]|uniref:Endonuclease/exonuclease/phosphatase domain-containing protein n=1 Tax=Hibiscus trionum TaxID=183268 RepID=A0A9W7HYS0_HIBTR|nr:hypothetical protein HRI_002281700 [Hibiscus trionum]
MDIKVFSWNVQGCGHHRFLPAVRQFLRDNRPNLIAFVEPRISGNTADSVIASLGFLNSHRVEADGFLGGIWLAWSDAITVDIIFDHFKFIHCRVTTRRNDNSFFATAIYASPSATRRNLLWHHLRDLASTIHSPWILFGDFNATLCDSECMGCASTKPSKAFQDFIFDAGLRDMGYQGPDFTWCRGSTYVRLDRFLCNTYWDESYPVAEVHHLLRMRSDHRPILLHVGG